MPRNPERFSLKKRSDRGTWKFSLNPESGLPPEVCATWRNKSLSTLPAEFLLKFKSIETRTAAERVLNKFIEYLREHVAEEVAPRAIRGTNVGAWMRRFLDPATSPRAASLLSENRPYSPGTIDLYKQKYATYIEGDPILGRSMEELEARDLKDFLGRLAAKKIPLDQRKKDDEGAWVEPTEYRTAAGSRSYEIVYRFVRMTFKAFQEEHPRWHDPFIALVPLKKQKHPPRTGLEEGEISKLFSTPGVFKTPLEKAVGAAMFWAGLRRSEIFGCLESGLDWVKPCIHVETAWKNFNKPTRELGDPKHHKFRETIFPDILQTAITELKKANKEWRAEHPDKCKDMPTKAFVFVYPNGKVPGPTWFKKHVHAWFTRAGIDIAGRKITPHSARHSLASVLEAQGVPLRYIQELLGHSDLETTLGYLHTPQGKINEITKQIEESAKK